jgi:hypothetical protein
MKKSINSLLMNQFIRLAVDQLEGDWVIIGGTVLPLLGIDIRVTVDIDLVSLEIKNSNQQNLKLMQIAESLGMPIESVNQAGAYFLSKIPDAKDNLILFCESKKCKIYRPNVYLFLKLKVARLSESDLEDCCAMVKNYPNEVKMSKKKILHLLKTAKLESEAAQNRLVKLSKFTSEFD